MLIITVTMVVKTMYGTKIMRSKTRINLDRLYIAHTRRIITADFHLALAVRQNISTGTYYRRQQEKKDMRIGSECRLCSLKVIMMGCENVSTLVLTSVEVISAICILTRVDHTYAY